MWEIPFAGLRCKHISSACKMGMWRKVANFNLTTQICYSYVIKNVFFKLAELKWILSWNSNQTQIANQWSYNYVCVRSRGEGLEGPDSPPPFLIGPECFFDNLFDSKKYWQIQNCIFLLNMKCLKCTCYEIVFAYFKYFFHSMNFLNLRVVSTWYFVTFQPLGWKSLSFPWGQQATRIW